MQAPFADPFPHIAGVPAPLLPIVGRDFELQLLSRVLDTVLFEPAEGPKALVISGETGIGKSRLLAELSNKGRQSGFLVLEGRTYESGTTFPYLPFIEALRPIIRFTPAETLRLYVGLEDDTASKSEYLDKAFSFSPSGLRLVRALSRLFPEIPGKLQLVLPPDEELLTPDQEKFRLFDALATFLERMSVERPVLLSIDNLQWSDSASLELTMYLTVRLHSSRVALAGATRSPTSTRYPSGDESIEPSSAAAQRMLADLVRQRLLLFLPLGPLNEESAEQHLRILLPGTISRGIIEPLLARAEGNPFFLEELVRMLTLSGQLVERKGVWHLMHPLNATIPESITLIVQERLRGLSPRCNQTMRVAALFGRVFPARALATVMKETEAGIQAVLDEALQASIIVPFTPDFSSDESMFGNIAQEIPFSMPIPSSVVYTFCQGIVQEVLSTQVAPYEARLLHGAIGSALEEYYDSTSYEHAAELAHHYMLGEQTQAALHWNLLAAEYAKKQQAYREAIAHFRIVLGLMEKKTQQTRDEQDVSPGQLWFSIGTCWFSLGELDRAIEALQQSLEHATPVTFLAAQANRMLADAYRMKGKYELALAHLRTARNNLAKDIEYSEKPASRSNEAPSFSWLASGSGAATIEQSVAQRERVHEQVLLLQANATLHILLNQFEEAEQALWRSHQLAAESGDRTNQAFALHLLGWIRGWGEHIHESIRLQEQAHELYLLVGDPFRAALGNQGLGIIYQALGEMEKARQHNLRGLELARRYAVRHVLGWLYCNQAIMALAEGNWQECELYFQQAMLEAEITENARLKPLVTQARAEYSLRLGDWKKAEEHFQQAMQAAKNTEWYPSCVALYGHFLAVTGRRAGARTYLEQAASLPEPAGYSGHFYIPFLAEGFLHLDAHAQATTYFERTQELRGFMYYGVAVDRIRGELAALQGNWDAAEEAFENGLTLCRKVGNAPEEAYILYEQSRTALMRSRAQRLPLSGISEYVYQRCQQANIIFARYAMHRASTMVDELQQGLHELEQRHLLASPGKVLIKQKTVADYQLELHLTRRELEVLRLVAEGHTDREVAEALVISTRTVNRHLSNIFIKLDVPGRAAAVAYALRHGLVG